MPTYQYFCTKCEHEFEKFQSIADKALSLCPKEICPLKRWGKGAVKRRIGAGAGIIFKGSGFYTTDYRSDKYKEAAKKESSAAAPAGGDSKAASGGSSAGGESKSASPKSEAKPAKSPKAAS